MPPTFSRNFLWYLNFEIIFSDIADGLVGVGLITQDQDNPGHLTLDKGYNDMSKFLNRILGMHVNKQNMLFKYFTDTLNKIIDNVSVYFKIYPHNNKRLKNPWPGALLKNKTLKVMFSHIINSKKIIHLSIHYWFCT